MGMGEVNQSRWWSDPAAFPVALLEQGDSSEQIPLGSAVGRRWDAGMGLGTHRDWAQLLAPSLPGDAGMEMWALPGMGGGMAPCDPSWGVGSGMSSSPPGSIASPTIRLGKGFGAGCGDSFRRERRGMWGGFSLPPRPGAGSGSHPTGNGR